MTTPAMDTSISEVAPSESNVKESTETSLSNNYSSVQEDSSKLKEVKQSSETKTKLGAASKPVLNHPDVIQSPQAKGCTPELKQDPPAEQNEASNPAVEPSPRPATETTAAASPAAGTDDCYRYEGETCIYTDPSSGVEYTYSADREGWLRRDGRDDDRPAHHAPTLENCYYVGEHYCFRDAAGTVYRLEPESNSWQPWSPPPDGREAPAHGEKAAAAAEADGDKAAVEAGTDGEKVIATAASDGQAAPADGEQRCFRDSTGAWCCRDDTGALCRWDAASGRWQRAEHATDTRAAGGRRSRKRRLNRGSSDDSEHDSDDEEEPPTASDRVGDGAEQQEPPSDGSGYEWDAEKGAWFPKIDEEFLALHRLNYGFDSEGRAVETAPILESAPPPEPPPPPPDQQAGKQRKLNTKKKPEWFQLDDSKNTKVYVSGLPDDTTEDEFVELMSKCGLVMKDPLKKNAWKIKLYRDDYGIPKGDAICTYIKIESVNLALSILDGSDFKGKRLKVEKATFDMKGQFDPSKKPKKRTLKKKDREKLQKKQEKLFAWQPDRIRGERERHERVVILKNLFSPEEFRTRPEALLEYQQELREECGKSGPVRKVVVHDRHPEGVAEVIFQEATAADACVLKMNGRWFAGRQLQADTWDGKTKYRVEETEEERAERLAKWEQFISGEDKPAEVTPAGGKASEATGAGEKASDDKDTGPGPGESGPTEEQPA